MINENHIIQFKYDEDLDIIFDRNNDFFIKSYLSSKYKNFGFRIIIHYNNLCIYNFNKNTNINIIFNISNMLYKLHTKDYYSKIHSNKLLI